MSVVTKALGALRGSATSDQVVQESYGVLSDFDKELIAWGEKSYLSMRSQRYPLERQWYVNLAFLFGRHNIIALSSTTSKTGFQLVTPKAPPWRKRLVINHIRKVIRTESAKLASQRPRPMVVPNTTEDEDLAAARVGEQIIEAVFTTPEVRSTIRSWIWWGSVTGTSFLKMFYDKEGKDHNGDKGKIDLDFLNSFELFVPNLVQVEIEKQPYVCHASTMTVDEIRHKYGVRVEPDTAVASDMIEDQFLNIVGARQENRDRVQVLEYWVKPGGNHLFPKGGMFVIGNGKLLAKKTDGIPYKHGEYPFYTYRAIETGRFYGESIIVDLIPLNREVNRSRSQILESRDLMSKPKLIGYKGSLDPKKITSEPGQFIPVIPGFDLPTPWVPPPLPQYVLELENNLKQDMDDLAGQHEISRGQNPTQVTAATALSYLQEQDDTKLFYPVAGIEDAIAKAGRHYLKLFMQYMSTPRLIKVVGRDGMFEVDHWKASDLKGNTDVRVEAGSALPRSKAAKQAFVMELMKFAQFPPEKMLELLDLQGIEKVYEEVLVDKRHAQRENLIMAKLTPEKIELASQAKAQITGEMDQHTPLVTVNDYDNHEMHIYYHNLFRKGQQFQALPPEVKEQFNMHVLMHRMALMEGTAPAQEQQRAEMEGQDGQAALEGGQAQQDPEAMEQAGQNIDTIQSGQQPPIQGQLEQAE